MDRIIKVMGKLKEVEKIMLTLSNLREFSSPLTMANSFILKIKNTFGKSPD